MRPPNLQSAVRGFRLRLGLTQAELASRAGISRQACGAIERGEAVPSVQVALRLSQVLGEPVERLFRLASAGAFDVDGTSSGDSAAGARVRSASVGGSHVLLSAEGWGGAGPELATGIVEGAPGPPSPGPVGGGTAPHPDMPVRPLPGLDAEAAPHLVLSGCDPATTLLGAFLRRTAGMELLWLPSGSRQALEVLARGGAHMAGFHLQEEDGEERPLQRILQGRLPFQCTVVGFAVWEQGLILAPGNPLGVGSVEDLARPELRLLNREEGSGSRAVLDRALARAGVDGSAIPGYQGSAALGHWAVAQGVAAGAADAGVGIRAAARAFGLAWVPLEEERYDLVIPDPLLNDPAVEALLDLLRSPALQAQVESLGGYDVAPMGRPA